MTMRMRIIIVLGLLLSLGGVGSAWGQSQQANITTNASTCAVTNTSCVISSLPKNITGIGLQLSGSWTGTISFEASMSGNPNSATWVALNMIPSNSATAASSSTSNGAWTVSGQGYQMFRARGSATMSGTAVVQIQLSTTGGN